MRFVVSKLRNPYTEMLYWIKGERLDIKAMMDVIEKVSRLDDIKKSKQKAYNRQSNRMKRQSKKTALSTIASDMDSEVNQSNLSPMKEEVK